MANPYIDALAGTSWLAAGFDNHITYAFDNSCIAWTEPQKADFRTALQSWANVANVVFEEVSAAASPEMNEAIVSIDDFRALFGPSTVAVHTAPTASGVTKGAFGVPFGDSLPTFVHEIGHALGLAHPHDNGQDTGLFPGVTNASELGDFGLNQNLYTVMSYNSFQYLNLSAIMPMAIDVAAIQQMYGANATFHSEDNVYALENVTGANKKMECIWDAGGTDSITYSGFKSVIIDLRPATLQPGEGAGGYLSWDGQFIFGTGAYTIAKGVLIENASGGYSGDFLTGNDAANVLTGNDGGDNINGGSGADKLFGGLDRDNLAGGEGNDLIVGGLDRDFLTGGLAADVFDFNSSKETGKIPTTRDVITDFKHAVDKIDLRDIDANSKKVGDQAFKFIATQEFHHVKGELRFVKFNSPGVLNDKTAIVGDTNGDGLADFQIGLKGLVDLTKGDFVL